MKKSLPMPFIKDKEVWKKGKTPFGFRCEISRTPDFSACSFFITNDEDLAKEWIQDTKNFEESHFKVKVYSRITEINIDYCEMCERHNKITPIEEGERFCLRCEDLMLEARDIQAEEYDKEEFGD
jgi:hypothetical protein